MPAVVPQLKTITLGGAVAGVGIESSSHRQGLVHDTHARARRAARRRMHRELHARDNEHSDLFFGFPNSYGTLGYALRVKAQDHSGEAVRAAGAPAFSSGEKYFAGAGRVASTRARPTSSTARCSRRKEMYITLGRFAEAAPYTSDYTYERIYYRSIAEKREDYLTAHDYIWRWDTDWFWCSKNVLAQNALVRRIYGRERLGSRTYTKIMRWNSRVGMTKKLERMLGLHSESVIQDVDIPIARAAEFLTFLREKSALAAVDLPDRPAGAGRFALYPVKRELVRELRLLGREAHARGAPAGPLQPPDRAQGARARRHQVALLGQLFTPSAVQPVATAARPTTRSRRNTTRSGAFPRLYDKCVLKA